MKLLKHTKQEKASVNDVVDVVSHHLDARTLRMMKMAFHAVK